MFYIFITNLTTSAWVSRIILRYIELEFDIFYVFFVLLRSRLRSRLTSLEIKKCQLFKTKWEYANQAIPVQLQGIKQNILILIWRVARNKIYLVLWNFVYYLCQKNKN